MFYLLMNVLKLCVFVLMLNPFTLVIGSLYCNIMFYLLKLNPFTSVFRRCIKFVLEHGS